MQTSDIMPISMNDLVRHLENRMRYQWTTGERSGPTPMLLGAPGMGKTAIPQDVARRVAAELGGRVLIVVANAHDREVPDIRGMALPVQNDDGEYDRLVYTRSALLPAPEVVDEFDYVLIMIDELPASTMDHIKSFMEWVLEYRAGNAVLDPRKFFLIATGNGVEHRSGASRLPAHGVNRMEMLHVLADVRPFLGWSDRPESGVPPLARVFVEQRPALFTEAKVPKEGNAAFATLRSFTNGMKSVVVSHYNGSGPIDWTDPDILDVPLRPENAPLTEIVLAASVGRAVAHEFVMWARVRAFLTPRDQIEKDPEGAPLPDRPDAIFAQASYIVAWTEKDNARAMVRYLMRMRKDLLVPTIQRMRAKEPAVMRVKETVKLVEENRDLFYDTAAARG